MAVLNTPDGGKPRGRPPKKLNGAAPSGQHHTLHEPTRYQHDGKVEFEGLVVPVSAMSTGILTTLAAPELLNADTTIDWLKVGFIGLAAGFVSYVVNDKAIKAGGSLFAGVYNETWKTISRSDEEGVQALKARLNSAQVKDLLHKKPACCLLMK